MSLGDLAGFAFEDGAWFERPGLRLVTRGTRRTLIVPPGKDQLERLADAARDSLEVGEIAVGAIGFDRNSQVVLEIVEDAAFYTDPEPVPVPSVKEPRSLRLEAFPTPERYMLGVAKAVERIKSHQLDKVVLARMLIAHSQNPFDRHRLLALLSHAEPSAYRFAVQGFIGASPELVIQRGDDRFHSRPLAGTLAKSAGNHQDLLNSQKDRHEHGIVVDAVVEGLAPFASDLRVSEAPSILETTSLLHLATDIGGTLQDPRTSVLDLLAAIHPTPAIAGTPRVAALDVIADTEGFDRTRYGGAVGWVDSFGNGEFALTIRCAEVRGRIATLFSGAGIVAESDPESELRETDAKFAPMLSALASS